MIKIAILILHTVVTHLAYMCMFPSFVVLAPLDANIRQPHVCTGYRTVFKLTWSFETVRMLASKVDFRIDVNPSCQMSLHTFALDSSR